MEKANKKVAVLIDAENVNASNAKQIFDTMSSYGEVIIKQIFADWSKPQVRGWREEIANYAMVSYHQFVYVSGKNTSDLALVIQAMIILYEKNVDMFCIVSSDSDLTRLVQELRERNKEVIGMGGRTSIKSYVNAFSEFIYLGEDIQHEPEPETAPKVEIKPEIVAVEVRKPPVNNHFANQPHKPLKFVFETDKLETMKEIIERLIDENGRAFYSQIAMEMKNKYSDFVPKNYNFKTLRPMMEKLLPLLREYEKVEEPLASNPSSVILSLIRKKKEMLKK
ncbi:MAG: NYN domain-containing protein [bacterium]